MLIGSKHSATLTFVFFLEENEVTVYQVAIVLPLESNRVALNEFYSLGTSTSIWVL